MDDLVYIFYCISTFAYLLLYAFPSWSLGTRKQIREGKALGGKDGAFAPLIKQITELALQAELETHLAQDLQKNRKNGKTTKIMKGEMGAFELEVPRDRNGSYEPQVVKKNQTHMSDQIEKKMLSLFALGNSYSQIAEYIEEIYGVGFSNATISAVTDKIIPMLTQWRERPLQEVYPFVWLDAIHYKVKEDGKYISKAFYTVLGVGIDGKKEILGLYLGENEGATFWLQVLTDLHNRGVEDILIASIDGLKGFPEAIKTIFPDTKIQLCVVHQIRNSLKYVASKNKKEFASDLKLIYQADTKEMAELKLDALEDKWGKKYGIVIKSWRNNWDNLSHYFQYPKEIKKIIYTTNMVESVHSQFRKLTKNKSSFPNDNNLLKLLFMGIQNAEKKWTMPIWNWSLTLSQLDIFFEGRLDNALKL